MEKHRGQMLAMLLESECSTMLKVCFVTWKQDTARIRREAEQRVLEASLRAEVDAAELRELAAAKAAVATAAEASAKEEEQVMELRSAEKAEAAHARTTSPRREVGALEVLALAPRRTDYHDLVGHGGDKRSRIG